MEKIKFKKNATFVSFYIIISSSIGLLCLTIYVILWTLYSLIAKQAYIREPSGDLPYNKLGLVLLTEAVKCIIATVYFLFFQQYKNIYLLIEIQLKDKKI